MSDEILAGCMTLLSGMPSSAPWTEANTALYALAMRDWPDEVGKDVVQWAVLNLKWRPAPVELREIAVNRHAPAPDAVDVREKIRHLLVFHGGKEAQKHANPFLRVVADAMGGWKTLSLLTSEEIDKRFPAAYADARQVHITQGGKWEEAEKEKKLIGRPLSLLPPQDRTTVIEGEDASFGEISTWGE